MLLVETFTDPARHRGTCYKAANFVHVGTTSGYGRSNGSWVHHGQGGIHLSVRALLRSLAGIEESVLLYQGERGRPRARRMLTEHDAMQKRLYDLFGLDTYAPKR